MPLYDCVLLLKPNVVTEAAMDLIARIGKHVYRRNGVLTNIDSFGTVQLGYEIKKLDGRYYQAKLMQMTMMTPPSFKTELQYLNKEDCHVPRPGLLPWLLVKHCDIKYGLEFSEDDAKNDLRSLRLLEDVDSEKDEDDEDEGEDNEYEVEQSGTTEAM